VTRLGLNQCVPGVAADAVEDVAEVVGFWGWPAVRVWVLARIWMVRSRRTVQANLLMGQLVYSSIRQLTGQAANTMVRWASIEAVPALLSEIARMSRILTRMSNGSPPPANGGRRRSAAGPIRAVHRPDSPGTQSSSAKYGLSLVAGVGAHRGRVISRHRPPLRLRLLPLAWPGEVSPM